MNMSKRDQRGSQVASPRRGAEMLLFLVVSVLGIYALGNGLTGLFEPGQSINLLWLAVSGIAMMILFAQMGRVHDTWPSRKAQQVECSVDEAQKPLIRIEER